MYLHSISRVREVLGADLLADDLGPDVVLLGQTQPHLLQDKSDFLLPIH